MPPPTTTSTLKKPPRWSWIVLGCVMATCLIFLLIATYSSSATEKKEGETTPQPDEEGLSAYERVNREPPLYLDLVPGETEAHAEIDLQPHRWSREVVIPYATDWRCSVRPPNGCRVWFRDEEEPRTFTKETPTKYGAWRGVFRLKGVGSEPQKATITITRK